MTLYVGFDTARPPFDDRRVRRAFALALDRETMADVVGRGLSFPATGGLVPPGIPGHAPGIGLPHDPEAARRSLAQAGFARAQDLPPLECLAWAGAGIQPYREYLQRVWREALGVQVTWTPLPWGALLDRLYSDPPNLWVMSWMADYADPDNFLRVAEWRAASHWHDEQYDRLIEAVRRIADQQRRLEMVRQADQMLVEEAPVVPLVYARLHMLAKPWLRVPPPTYGRLLFKDFVLDPH